MALRARNRSEVHANFQIIHPEDPAVDRSEFAALRRYEKSWDLADCPLKPGFTPTTFTCRPLSARAVLLCDSQQSEEYGWFFAFQFGVVSIEGMDAEEEIDLSSTSTESGPMIKDTAAQVLLQRFGAEVVYTIGRAILARAHLTVSEKKASAP